MGKNYHIPEWVKDTTLYPHSLWGLTVCKVCGLAMQYGPWEIHLSPMEADMWEDA